MVTDGKPLMKNVKFVGKTIDIVKCGYFSVNLTNIHPCILLSCQRGKVSCEPVVCPPTNCSNPIIEEGACCPTCNSPRVDGRGCHFGGDSFFHPAGSRWHPYIPPFGFSRCAICTCKVIYRTKTDILKIYILFLASRNPH